MGARIGLDLRRRATAAQDAALPNVRHPSSYDYLPPP
jgi:hypothetical protein